VSSIRSLQQRKHREATGLFFVEGIRPVAEALQLGAPIERLVVSPDLLASEFAMELVAREAGRGTEILRVTDKVFASISEKDGPQGLAAVIHQRWRGLNEIELQDDGAFVALDSVQDPGNLGTIIRTADTPARCVPARVQFFHLTWPGPHTSSLSTGNANGATTSLERRAREIGTTRLLSTGARS